MSRHIQLDVSIYSGGRWVILFVVTTLFAFLSCGGGSNSTKNGVPSAANPGATQDICNCNPSGPASSDFRHDAKHVALPGSSGQDINVATMMSWGTPPDQAFDAPRTGRELQMFHIAHAWMFFVWLVGSDCDVHMEIADTPDPNAPRAIVETPVDGEFCPARQNEQQQFSAHNVPISMNGFDLQTPLPVEVLGLAFQDFNHPRGTTHVATVWELHPAVVNVLPQ